MPFFKWFPQSKFLEKKICFKNNWINLSSKKNFVSRVASKDINDFQIQVVILPKISKGKEHGRERRDCLLFIVIIKSSEMIKVRKFNQKLYVKIAMIYRWIKILG